MEIDYIFPSKFSALKNQPARKFWLKGKRPLKAVTYKICLYLLATSLLKDDIFRYDRNDNDVSGTY